VFDLFNRIPDISELTASLHLEILTRATSAETNNDTSTGWLYLFLAIVIKRQYNLKNPDFLKYIKLAEQYKNIYSKYYLGEYHYFISENYEEAMKYYLEGYKLGDHIFCPNEIGYMFEYCKDKKCIVANCNESSYNNPLTNERVCDAHKRYDDIKIDNSKLALKWYKIAAENGNTNATGRVIVLLKSTIPFDAVEYSKYIIKTTNADMFTIRCITELYHRIITFNRLQSLDIGSLVYYDVKRYI
jgi:hypothetical protein